MKKRILALALTVGLLGLPAATPAAASDTSTLGRVDSVVVVNDADLPELLASGTLGQYTLINGADLGLDEASLVGLGLFGENTVLTPTQLGLDTPDYHYSPFFGGFGGFVTVPVVRYRTFPVYTPFYGGFGFYPGFGFNRGFNRGVTVIVRVR